MRELSKIPGESAGIWVCRALRKREGKHYENRLGAMAFSICGSTACKVYERTCDLPGRIY